MEENIMTLKKILVLLTALTMIAAVSCKKEKEPEKIFKTVSVDTNLIENPAEAKPVNVQNGKVKRGEYLILEEERDFGGKKFLRVTIEGVKTNGWINSANVKEGKLKSITIVEDTDMYMRPNIKSDKIGTVKAGQVAFNLESSGDFILIQYPGKEGYILRSSIGDAGDVVKTVSITGVGKAEISASSQYLTSEGRETDYDPRNVFDGKIDTSWCEGKSGDGIGEYITITLNNYMAITSISMVNGSAKSEESYYNNNRVASLKITSDTGESVIVNFDDSTIDYQTRDIDITGRTFNFILNSVYKGQKFSDTCISEIKLKAEDRHYQDN
jgi:major membrane immunogen (membrane-anchored lipoprotein)